MTTSKVRVERSEDGCVLAGPAAGPEDLQLCNDYLSYLADRHYAPGTRRSYAFDLLALLRWLIGCGLGLEAVDTNAVLGFLSSCRQAGLAATTTNRRLAAVSGLFAFRSMRDPSALNPMPRHLASPQPRSPLRARQARQLPRGLDRTEVTALLASLRAWRDRAIAGLMLFSGLRSGEVLALAVSDVDIGGGWARVAGKGGRERRVPLDAETGGWVQAYLLAERPDTTCEALFVVGKGPNRGQSLSPAGLRTIFRYHRGKAGVPAAHPHALRHSFGTALAEAGVDLAVIQSLLGHAHVDSSVGYINPWELHRMGGKLQVAC